MPKSCNTASILDDSAQIKKKRRPASTQSRVQSELRRLHDITRGQIPDDQRKIALPLMSNLAFLKVKLDEARTELMNESIYTTYDNGGGQSGIREHPGFSAYNKLLTTYSRCCRQLSSMMPKGSPGSDDLMDYLNETRL